jgi:hypothetical protein
MNLHTFLETAYQRIYEQLSDAHRTAETGPYLRPAADPRILHTSTTLKGVKYSIAILSPNRYL